MCTGWSLKGKESTFKTFSCCVGSAEEEEKSGNMKRGDLEKDKGEKGWGGDVGGVKWGWRGG